jgi:DNA gyrase subunit B
MTVSNTYNADSIQALTGLAHVRQRPLMYLGSAGLGVIGLHHLIWEIVDNSVDEAMAGHGDRVIITLAPDGSVSVQDFGRGIPIDPMKDGTHKGRSALEVVLTETNAGGKFDSDSYKVSGGLHGVGASVVTGLSTRLEAEVWRGGRRHQIGFKLEKDKKAGFVPGVADGPVRDVGPVPRSQTTGRSGTGTIITFWPDLTLFRDDHGDPITKAQWSTRLIAERLRHKSFVHPGLTFELRDDRDKANKTVAEWCSKGGVADLVSELTAETDTISPVLAFNGVAEAGTKAETTLHASVAWTVEGRDTTLGYANGVANPEGGTHVNGFRAAITEAVQNHISSRGLLKEKEDMPSTRDIFAGAIAVVSIMIPSPAFAGNSKGKLMNPEAAGRTRSVVLPQMAKWLEENPTEAKRVADGAIAVMRARTKSNADQLAAKALLAKGSKSRGGLPAKLRDCTRKTTQATELLLVEGDSAGGTAIDARDPSFQAILPLRGKPLNSYSETLDRVVKSGTLADLILTLGCSIGDDYDIDKLRYQHVMVVADADKDGQHIRTLLTVFFYRWMPGLIESGRVLYAMPPLWSTVVRGDHVYLADDNALAEFRAANPTHKAHVGRMKGLGEMDHRELRMVIGAGRTVGRIRVSDPVTLAQLAERLFGPKSEGRKEWFLQRTGHSLDIADSHGADAPIARSTVTEGAHGDA